jgi:holo-[acyl-carrier protein] synthase
VSRAPRPEPVVRVGVDVVAVDRMTRLFADHPVSAERLFTERELAYCRAKRHADHHLAARFAAKEAVLKAFGTGIGAGIWWTDVEVVSGRYGRPHVELHGPAAEWAAGRELSAMDLSLTHDGGVALAHVVTIWHGSEEQPWHT